MGVPFLFESNSQNKTEVDMNLEREWGMPDPSTQGGGGRARGTLGDQLRGLKKFRGINFRDETEAFPLNIKGILSFHYTAGSSDHATVQRTGVITFSKNECSLFGLLLLLLCPPAAPNTYIDPAPQSRASHIKSGSLTGDGKNSNLPPVGSLPTRSCSFWVQCSSRCLTPGQLLSERGGGV